MTKTTAAAALAASLLAACTTTSDRGARLEGTSWRLVEMRSMDDAQGITRADDPDRYTITFGTDRAASIKLDCNRGRGLYETASTGEQQGFLQFGNIASTRAMCPPDSLGDKLAQQLGFVRSYVLRDGRLNMSLMADGGILVWEPAAAEGS
jgi:heat shock protein HslJ